MILVKTNLNHFYQGWGISNYEYKEIEGEIKNINFLNRLDLYRWADGSNILEIEGYIIKLRSAYEKMLN